MSDKDHINRLISCHVRRWKLLKERHALYGRSTDPGILIEIEDIEVQIQSLQTELNEENKDLQNPSKLKPVNITHIPILGQVSAGKDDEFDGLEVYASDPNDDSLDSIPSPQKTEIGANIVALEVVGNSMEAEGIFSGHYVIVELKDVISCLNENKMIVTYYLPKSDQETTLDADVIDPLFLSLKGPTLKIFKGSYIDSNNRIYYRLGTVRDNGKKNPHEIETRVIKPIGVVIGVYRPVA